MRKLEGIVKEIVEEMGYLKKREERFTDTNSTPGPLFIFFALTQLFSINEQTCPELCMVHPDLTRRAGSMADLPPPRIFQAEIPHRLEWSSRASGFYNAPPSEGRVI
jgi:hypothetical protein